MPTPVNMPMLGLTMEEGTVAEWLKQEGDTVARDEPLLMVEMDKGTQEVTAPVAGVLRRILVQPGQTVPIRTPIAEIAEPGEAESPGESDAATGTVPAPGTAAASTAGAAPPVAAPISAPPSAVQPEGQPPVAPPDTGGVPTARQVAEATVGSAVGTAERLFSSPRARLRARELGLDLQAVAGTGPRGRVVEEDVLAAAHASPARSAAASGPTPAREAPLAAGTAPPVAVPTPAAPAAAPAAAVPVAGAVVPLSRLRRLTAERMAASSRTVARVTLLLEADLTEAARLRAQLAPEFARRGVPKLPWDALLAKAAGLALADYPEVRAQWVEGQGLRPVDGCHVAVAIALGEQGRAGLVAPVLRDADRRSLRELAADLLALVEQARAGRLPPSAYEGGTFTVSNLGAYRIDGFTPVITLPQAAILGVGRITDKPAVVDGQVTVRTLCTLSLAFDHRVVDGAPAAAFLARLAELLERPYALLGG